MGTINCGISDYITIGVRTSMYDKIWDEMEESGNYNHTEMYDILDNMKETFFQTIQTELKKHYFEFYHITIKNGYYDGFYIDIEANYPIAFNDWQEKKDAQKEITELKNFLIDCAGLGLVECFPGWCTGYSDYKETIAAIRKVIKEMRQEVKTTPTWAQYERGKN